jgi:hypothetical protein
MVLSETETPWTRLATRVVRVAMARKDISYSELASALSVVDPSESERAVVTRTARGTIKLSFLLQIIHLTAATPPSRWVNSMRDAIDWNDCARLVIQAELAHEPWVTTNELVRRLTGLNVHVSEKTLANHLSAGTIPLPLFLACLATIGSTSLDRYVDYEDILLAARQSAGAARPPV